MKNKRTFLSYTLECPGYWWSNKSHTWFILTDELVHKYQSFSSHRNFRTKIKALSALDNVRHIKGSFVCQNEYTKNGGYLLCTWTNK
jgi:hypothetical protein